MILQSNRCSSPTKRSQSTTDKSFHTRWSIQRQQITLTPNTKSKCDFNFSFNYCNKIFLLTTIDNHTIHSNTLTLPSMNFTMPRIHPWAHVQNELQLLPLWTRVVKAGKIFCNFVQVFRQGILLFLWHILRNTKDIMDKSYSLLKIRICLWIGLFVNKMQAISTWNSKRRKSI